MRNTLGTRGFCRHQTPEAGRPADHTADIASGIFQVLKQGLCSKCDRRRRLCIIIIHLVFNVHTIYLLFLLPLQHGSVRGEIATTELECMHKSSGERGHPPTRVLPSPMNEPSGHELNITHSMTAHSAYIGTVAEHHMTHGLPRASAWRFMRAQISSTASISENVTASS